MRIQKLIAPLVLAGALSAGILPAEEALAPLDDFSKIPGAWNFWQPGDRSFSMEKAEAKAPDGSNALRLDMKNGYGLAQRGLKLQSAAEGLQFWLRGANGTAAGALRLSLAEDDGETFFVEIPFDGDWKSRRVLFKDMKLWPYGGAPIRNGKFEPEKAATLKLSPRDKTGIVVEIANLQVLSAEEGRKEAKAPGVLPEVELKALDMEEGMPPRASFDALPGRCSSLSISGTNFLRDGKPSFLIGEWQWENWLLRLEDVDIGYFGADNIYSQYAPKEEGGKLLLERTPCPWYEALIYRMESNGLALWHEHKADGQRSPLKQRIPDAIDAGHFFVYNPFNPLGRQLYADMFKSWTRYTRKYPVFCYEALNEVSYTSKHKEGVAEFRRRMKARYADIARANAAWGTSFKSFDEVQPPGVVSFKADGAETELERRQAKAYPNLWADWLKFQEEQFGEAAGFLVPEMMSSDKRPGVFSTIQSHCSLGWGYGGGGVHPSKIAKSPVDFYSHEDGLRIFPQTERNDVKQIKSMASMAMVCDLVADLCPAKPVFNAESPLYVSRQAMSEEELLENDLGGFEKSPWQFFDASSAPPPEGWTELAFDASSWKSIKVPEMWGKQGFAKCTDGLYRKTFKLPADAPTTLYLSGKEFADAAEIHFNGRPVFTTKLWDEAFCVKIDGALPGAENVLCAKLQNRYFKDGMYYGGIRGYVALTKSSSLAESVLKPAYVRAHLWLQAVHGMSGDFICYDNTNYQDAIKVTPAAKAEIASVAEIVLPRPRIQAQAAIVYPFESFRVFYPDSYEEYLKAPLVKELLSHYCALLFDGLGVDVIANSDIEEGKASKYKLLVMAGNRRVSKGCVEALKSFVANGGVLVSEMDSLTFDDDAYANLNLAPLLGVEPGPCGKASGETLESREFGLSKVKLETRRVDGASFAEARLSKDAKPLAKLMPSGKTALSSFPLGKGTSYYLGAALPYQALRELYAQLATRHGLRHATLVERSSGARADFVETQVFSKAGRNVLYALNWGMKDSFKFKWSEAPEGRYLLRQVLSAQTLKSPAGKELWSAEELRAGIKVNLDNMDPLVLLAEREELKPLALKGISPLRREMLSRLWNPAEDGEAKGDAPVLAIVPDFDTLANTPLPNSATPTAEELLRLSGFKVREYNAKMPLAGVAAILWKSPFTAVDETRLKELRAYVENGGSLLLFGNAMVNWHTGLRKNGTKLWETFGLGQGYMKWLSTAKPLKGFDFMQVPCPVVSKAPALHGVAQFTAAFAGPIEAKDKKAYEVLLRAPEGSSLAGEPLIVEGKIGKGKVIAIGDSAWLAPLNFELGDNPQLLLSLVRRATDLEPATLPVDVKGKALYINRETLAEAERQEAKGIYSFKPIRIEEKASERKAVKSSSGYLDPIVDMQN